MQHEQPLTKPELTYIQQEGANGIIEQTLSPESERAWLDYLRALGQEAIQRGDWSDWEW